ncbi:hypothetical protein RFI_13904 [Reticulomyxa filosa]|uniref:CS domain-containing protein n=1 Tax=Reticulomyxa filosa TaxID=46433 RepID=X6NBK4_RETFI|nr:hypothetical protein RFI_13904 [Reticulomyxa filosa]|eukprot:ETO23278.1 hypothetical protein RFI_13904 [Reticulomyxa filosa]
MTGINYSKWNKIAEALDSSDEESASNTPHVTKLDRPSSVTIGPTGVTINPSPSNNQSTNANNKSVVKKTIENPTAKQSYNSTVPRQQKDQKATIVKPQNNEIIESKVKTKTLSELKAEVLTVNGGETDEYMWSQTRDEVVLFIKNIPLSTKAKSIKIQYNEEKNTVFIQCLDKILYNNKELSYNIVKTKEEDCGLEWEIKTFPFCDTNGIASQMKLLTIYLKKKEFSANVITWWGNVFKGDPSIDVAAIKERKTDAKTMRNIWQSAHESFKEKVKQFQPQTIEIDPDEEDNDEKEEHQDRHDNGKDKEREDEEMTDIN